MLSRFAAIERASIDEAYLDLTGSARHRLRQLRGRPLPAELLPSTFVQGLPAEPGPRPAEPGGKGTHRPPLCLPRMQSVLNGSVFSAVNGFEGTCFSSLWWECAYGRLRLLAGPG